MPRDLPIPFKPPLVRSILAGTKTQTRRIIDFDGVDRVRSFEGVATDKLGRRVYEMRGRLGQHVTRPAGTG